MHIPAPLANLQTTPTSSVRHAQKTTPSTYLKMAAAVLSSVASNLRSICDLLPWSKPVQSEVLSRKALSSSTPRRFIPAHVAVAMPVTAPPHRSPRAALPHEAPILDVWRQSEHGDKDEEHAAGESIDQPAFASATTSDDASGPDGATWSSRAGLSDSGMRTDCRCFRLHPPACHEGSLPASPRSPGFRA